MPDIRCSSLPLISQCSAAAALTDIPLDRSGGEARLGTACHAVQALVIGHLLEPSLDDVLTLVPGRAKIHGVDEGELEHIVRQWWYVWSEVKHHFPSPQAERFVESQPLGLSGHIDVLSVADGNLRIMDLKTGWRTDGDYLPQLMGYSRLCLQQYPDAQSVYCAILWVRDRSIEGHTWTREELATWWTALQARIADGRYNPGAHCGYCPRSLKCPAKTAMLQQASLAVSVLAGAKETGTSIALDPIYVYDRLKTLKGFCDQGIDLIRALVAEAGGTLTAPDGRQLVLTESPRVEISAEAGWDVLFRELGFRFPSCLSISKTAVENAVREMNPRGQKKAAVDSLMQSLADAGALETTIQSRLTVRRAPTLAITQEAK